MNSIIFAIIVLIRSIPLDSIREKNIGSNKYYLIIDGIVRKLSDVQEDTLKSAKALLSKVGCIYKKYNLNLFHG